MINELYYYIRYKIFLMKIKIKSLVKPAKEELDLTQCLIITELTYRDFRYEDFVCMMKKQAYGHFGVQDIPQKVHKGHYRKHIAYRTDKEWDNWYVVYIARDDGFFKIDISSQVKENLSWSDIHKARNMCHELIMVLYTYRHRPMDELRELVINKKILEEL